MVHEMPTHVDLSLIIPTVNNKIPPDGRFLQEYIDDYRGERTRLKQSMGNPPNFQNGLKYLGYVTERGDIDGIEHYLRDPDVAPKTWQERLERAQILREGYMNSAEAARRRSYYYSSQSTSPMTIQAEQELEGSRRYLQRALNTDLEINGLQKQVDNS